MPKDEYQSRAFNIVGTRPIRPDGIDKVTGKARYGADMTAPGMLWGAILRSPHAHARIKSIDTSEAEAMKGVKAVITRADFPKLDLDPGMADILDNSMAGEKALYDGHAVAAVAASSKSLAYAALDAIKVEYEVLPHVVDVDLAMKPDAPVIHAARQDETVPEGLSENVTSRSQYGHGDPEEGFKKADLVIERHFTTAATHQGYIEPNACLAQMGADGQGDLFVCTQGHYMVRDTCAEILGLEAGKLRVTASEIGGGFGGKTHIWMEPVALMLSMKSGKPVKLVLTRDEVFRATGPTSSSSTDIKIGMTKDGKITAATGTFRLQSGAYPGATAFLSAMCGFAPYDLEHVRTEGLEVMTNRPKAAAYRAPGSPMAAYAVESVIDELCQKLDLDPLETRLKNAAREGTKSAYGPTYPAIGLEATLKAAQEHPHWTAPLGENQGRGVACGFWFNFGGNTSVNLMVNPDGTVSLSEGNPDIGGSRASMSMMAAEELGIPLDQVRCVISDTGSLGLNDVTDGSRVTFAVGLATIKAARHAIEIMKTRAAMKWGIEPEAVDWVDGAAVPAGPNAGKFPPMSIKEIAAIAANTGGPIAGHCEANAEGAGVSFATHMVDTEVDPETGAVKVLRYTVFQDAGKAIHPDYVEGQFQGGAAQGIGWALNEEYIHDEDGRLLNAGFLDYRIPVASDLPMIEPVILEIPNPGHPYGVRGVGETSIVPPLAAIANSVSRGAGVRLTSLPMSPPKIRAAVKAG
ncbi:xanthine dehydrogenase family protein molybdopterin-binding subunit [Rhodalgimonas zhirmunskyi]|uniref:Xanthine dehydrogenase family protein molybdopterin-binding subunit n=1 Tax=Rhodalgimonas zhirmunskyi TaxID=2964767 RepID=A0AAJ1X649_9RHOB|nr:xanthine dehydrogenase family protein molybdopterin-binding subunit [Rhodoalgimonas zhirmunskyi]MDQ2095903.1 xanthine dehydrogenase family protein molybdopterin-binding subunit [Rhodoalgimonas zhirmunskyi]